MLSHMEPFSNTTLGLQRVLPHHMALAACSASDAAADVAGFRWGFWICLLLFNGFPFWKLWLPLPNSSWAWNMHFFFFFRNFSANVLESWNSERVQAAKRNWVKKDWITSGFCCVHLGTFLCFCAISHSVSLLSICLFLSSLSICWSLSVSCPTPRLTLPCASTHTHRHICLYFCLCEDSQTQSSAPKCQKNKPKPNSDLNLSP